MGTRPLEPGYVLVDTRIYEPAKLTIGRCCGRKPLTYKRDAHHFCTRCSRSFDLQTKEQIPNWAWARLDSGFQSTQKRKIQESRDE